MKLKFITSKDYDQLKPYDAIVYDKRSFFALFFNFLIKDNSLFNLFFSNSIINPLWHRLVKFYLDLIIVFSFSAFFFSDFYIDERAELPEKERVKINFKNIEFSLFCIV